MSSILVLCEQSGGLVKKTTLAGITFGKQLAAKTGGGVHLLAIGSGSEAAARELSLYGAAKVHVAGGQSFASFAVEAHVAAVAAAAQAVGATHIVASASSTSKDVLPRVAARLRAAMASDVVELVAADTFKRPMWAGNVLATVRLTTPVKLCTVRATEFALPERSASPSPVAALEVELDPSTFKTKLVSFKEMKSSRPDVTTADVVVSGGRGLRGSEGFKLIEQLADLLQAGVGASRAACDAGWVPNDLQIGQTGKIVGPNLYIAVGISGAIQHLAGMKASKTIVAINKDPEAPIFQVADYGLVADLFTAVPELIAETKKLRG